MGNYNADKNYNKPQSNELIRNMIGAGRDFLRFDQWTIDSAHRVSSFHDGTKKHQVHILFDQRQIPG